MITRREFGRAALTALAGAALVPATLRADFGEETFWYPYGNLPILIAGEGIVFHEQIQIIETFEPLFGASRPVVNPTCPTLLGRRALQFPIPGEYYLRINGRNAVKVLVLGPEEPPSTVMLRFFDFCVANLAWGSIDEQRWYDQRSTLPKTWLQSEEPLVFSCGPTHQLFRDIVTARFGFPTRIVTFPGAFWAANGEMWLETHNLPEVYLPDLGKWVMFDVNNAYVPLWLDSIELAGIVSRSWGSREDPLERWEDLPVVFHSPMETQSLNLPAYDALPAAMKGRFNRCLLDSDRTVNCRNQKLRIVGGGPAFWGARSRLVESGGTEFLPFDYAWASQQCDPALINKVFDWIATFDSRVTIVNTEVMCTMLSRGHAPTIARAEWSSRPPFA